MSTDPTRLRLGITLGSLMAFALAGIAYFYTGPSLAAPAIVWSPGSVSQTVAAGEAKTVVVAFTASENLSNVTPWVVPELQEFVQVAPTTFGAIAKGQTATLTLTTVVPITALPGTFEGSIHLRQGNRTIAKPLPVTLKITRNVQPVSFVTLGAVISFQIPQQHAALKDDQQNIVVQAADAIPPAGDDGVPIVALSVLLNPNALTIADYFDGSPGESLFNSYVDGPATLVIDQRPAYRFVQNAGLAGDIIVIVPLPGRFLMIRDVGTANQDNGLFDAIMSTLHVTVQ